MFSCASIAFISTVNNCNFAFYLYIDSTEKDISRLSDDDSQKLWSEIHRHNAIKGDGAVSVSFWRFAVSSFPLPPGCNHVST